MAKVNIDNLNYSSFDIGGEPASIGTRWAKWLRGFKRFAIAKGVTDDFQKKNLLLVCAGPEVQDLYDGLNPEDDIDAVSARPTPNTSTPGAGTGPGAGGGGGSTSEFDEVVDILTKHFEPQVNVPFERHLFKQMTPEVGESTLKFIARLKARAKNCQFSDSDDQIRDQVIHTVKSDKLRRKLLESGKDLTLDRLKEIATSFEAVENQMASMSVSEVNKISHKESSKAQAFRPNNDSFRST